MSIDTRIETFEYHASKTKLRLSLASAAVFVTGGTLMCIYTKLVVLGVILIGMGIAIFFTIRKMINNPKPLLRIDPKGISVSTGQLDVSLLWSDIKQFKGNIQEGMENVYVFLNDPEPILNTLDLSNMKRKMYRSNLTKLGTFVFFPTAIINMNTIELLKLLEKYRKIANKTE